MELVQNAIQNMESTDPSLDAEEARVAKLAYLEETQAQHESTMLQVLRCICELSASTITDGEDGNESAVHKHALLTLKSFIRRYLLQLAAMSDAVQQEVANATSPEAKGAFDEYLFGFA